MKNKATVLGLMSGSSLDGLDACLASFSNENEIWSHEIKEVATFSLPNDLKNQLRNSALLDGKSLIELDIEYGEWISKQIMLFVPKSDLISLHGHTVFHEPEKKISLQIGSGEVISVRTKKPVVASFRNADILNGGQGAPLVPVGEKLLFPKTDGFINLGGICNASFRSTVGMIAGDVGPFNQVFNYYATQIGQPIDTNGDISRSGQPINELIESWEQIVFFKKSFPKSLSNQWVSEHFLLIDDHSPKDILSSFSHFIATQLSKQINLNKPESVLITGGGAYHSYVIDLLRSKTESNVIIPDNTLIEFKEALIFALLGLLRFRGDVNALSSCTGASCDTSSGVIYQGNQNV